MFSKPFKPPLLRNTVKQREQAHLSDNVERPRKRQRVSDDDVEQKVLHKKPAKLGWESSTTPARITPTLRKPLTTLDNPPSPEQPKSELTQPNEGYYMVLWRKYTAKKHKTWDGDGVLAVRGGYATLQDISGRDMGRTAFSDPLLPGSTLSLGGRDVEVDSIISKAEFLAGNLFSKPGKASVNPPAVQTVAKSTSSKPTISVEPVQSKPKGSLQSQLKAEMLRSKKESKKKLNVVAAQTAGMKTAFKNPYKDSTVVRQVPGERLVPRHDPHAPGALVMKRPTTVPKDRQVVDVVLDPLLGKHLRKHQREGVAFLYECVMGMRDFGGEGCVLADEMGLGKTLQTIALLWTLLKQNPVHAEGPVIKKALIVCPVTLINNWQNEFRKWLGNERIGVFVADGKKTRLTDFTMGKSYSVMIIGYERLRSVAEDLTKGAGIDIVIADEGHRLKTVQNKSAQAIQSLNTSKRIILSGTPIQNDLSEFFSMVNFVNDGLLGTYKQFLKNFENPIVKSRQPDALEKDVELGECRSAELARETSKFILRRTSDILSKYLPPKTEYVLFCTPTPTQAKVYRHVLASPMFQSALGSSESTLQLITILKKLCNSPSLLNPKIAASDETANSASIISLLETLPQNLIKSLGAQASSKIRILDSFLYTLSRRTSEKIVLVSNYTSTLDLLQTLLTSLSLPFLRLDGSTPSAKRQALVDDFNRSASSTVFAFLLSAKAGGMGLNLIGASRLVLFDVDWNPAVEEQAMARIHREGQKKPCRIYRFVMKGGLEERVWQRQVVKRGLASSIIQGGGGLMGGGKKGVAQFSRDELRDLFRLDESPHLRTHDLIGCPCRGRGVNNNIAAVAIEEPDQTNTVTGPETDDPFFVEAPEEEDDDADSLPDLHALVQPSPPSNAALHPQDQTVAAAAMPLAQSRHRMGGSDHAQQQPQLGPGPERAKDAHELQGLMEYTHIDTACIANASFSSFASPSPSSTSPSSSSSSSSSSSPPLHPADTDTTSTSSSSDAPARLADMRELIDDAVLMEVLSGGGEGEAEPGRAGGIAWVFKKTSGRGSGRGSGL